MRVLSFAGQAGHSLLLTMALAVWSGRPSLSQEITRGLDHVPVAVKDLEHSKADFEALGFVLKPGRPHANGPRNQHVKFRDGTEIERILPRIGPTTSLIATRLSPFMAPDWRIRRRNNI